MNILINKIKSLRVWALFRKELNHIKRNRQLIASLVIPPTVQLLLFGFALNLDVTGLRLGVVDEARAEISRDLISSFSESKAFDLVGSYGSTEELGRELAAGRLDAGLVIPSDLSREHGRGAAPKVQFLLDGVNSNTAGIAAGYAEQIIAAFNQRRAGESQVKLGASVRSRIGWPIARIALLYNPGLKNSWFILSGVLGILLVLNGSLVAASAMVKEKELGTVEQLLMTPAAAWEIIIAKMGPLFLLLSADIWLALAVGWLVFGLPVRGSLVLLYFSGALCVMAGIGMGTVLATFSRSQQQAQLMSFFVNPPVAMLSGATTPLEAMPDWMQPLTLINPVRHFATIARGIMLKGAGVETLYPNLLALAAFSAVLVGVSVWRFRKQLG
ncbi:MAG TPA: ABC transporter permease [Blastocatellia bacterium]|nr:ABC transporter permease [Blastocatellia bacterium]